MDRYERNSAVSNFAAPDMEDDEYDLEVSPKDEHFVVMMVCTMLGIATLFPWNALITAADYFQSVFDNNAFGFYVSLAYNYPQVPTMIAVIYFGPRFSFTSRIISTLSAFMFLQLFVPFITSIGLNTTLSLWLTLGATFCIGAAFSINFGTILGLGALFPPEYTTAMMSGMGIGGVMVGLLRIITKGAFAGLENGLLVSTWIYFACASGVVALTIVLYLYMMRLPFTKYYLRKYEAEKEKSKSVGLVEEDITDKEQVPFFETYKKIWVDSLTVFWVFFVTLSLFPGLTYLIQPTMFSDPQGWFPIILVFLFQVFDFVGRTWPYFVTLPNRSLWILSLLRTIFVPLFIFCVNPLLFDNDLWYYSFMILFAFSNGFVGTWAMAYAPGKVTAQEQERAGMVMSFFLQAGIFCATHFALVILVLVKGTDALPWNA